MLNTDSYIVISIDSLLVFAPDQFEQHGFYNSYVLAPVRVHIVLNHTSRYPTTRRFASCHNLAGIDFLALGYSLASRARPTLRVL